MSKDNQERLDPREIVLDREAELPIGLQLAWALRAKISSAQLLPGERLPGMRELAEATGVNVNTVKAVYQRLEQEGLIVSEQGSGTFLSGADRAGAQAAAIARQAARRARELGVAQRDVATALYVMGPPAGDSQALRRQALRDQIGVLERALAELVAAHPGLGEPPEAEPGASQARLTGAEELEAVRAGLLRRLAALQGALDEPRAAHAPVAAAPERADRRQAARGRAPIRPAAAEG